jgi:hypothetical protein
MDGHLKIFPQWCKRDGLKEEAIARQKAHSSASFQTP